MVATAFDKQEKSGTSKKRKRVVGSRNFICNYGVCYLVAGKGMVYKRVTYTKDSSIFKKIPVFDEEIL